ncbi:hypothetical protein WI665_16135, partial [Vibrio cholerae]
MQRFLMVGHDKQAIAEQQKHEKTCSAVYQNHEKRRWHATQYRSASGSKQPFSCIGVGYLPNT